jgi:hypothetical protein
VAKVVRKPPNATIVAAHHFLVGHHTECDADANPEATA